MTDRTRAEHVRWCKERAREYLKRSELVDAVSSMISDMSKHPDTRMNPHLALLGALYAKDQDHAGVSRFIEGFAE